VFPAPGAPALEATEQEEVDTGFDDGDDDLFGSSLEIQQQLIQAQAKVIAAEARAQQAEARAQQAEALCAEYEAKLTTMCDLNDELHKDLKDIKLQLDKKLSSTTSSQPPSSSGARDGAAGTLTAPAPARPSRPSADQVAVGVKRRAGARDGAAGTSTAPAPAHPPADPTADDGNRKRREPPYNVPPIVGKHCSFCRQSDCAQGGSLHQCKAVNCMRLWSDRCIGRYAGDDDQKRCFHHAKCLHHEHTNCPECVQNCMTTSL
jgi:hypothetical protein